MRDFVRNHPAYKFDSVVSAEINYDLVHAIDEIERGVRRQDTLLPSDYAGSDSVNVDINASGTVNVDDKSSSG